MTSWRWCWCSKLYYGISKYRDRSGLAPPHVSKDSVTSIKYAVLGTEQTQFSLSVQIDLLDFVSQEFFPAIPVIFVQDFMQYQERLLLGL
jgi:hypothetical protein